MKEFFKMMLASFTGYLLYSIVGMIMFFVLIFSVLNAETGPVMPEKAVLTIDMSQIALTEQTREITLAEMLQGTEPAQPVGILDAVASINAAAYDPAVKYIFLKPDATVGGPAQIEELRQALVDFRECGKPVVSYIENPTNAGYYLASASDKIYMTPHDGGLNTFTGLSSQMIFLKDALDRLGINVQLIRHGKYKSAGEMFVRNSSSKENMEQNAEMVDSMWESWSNQIAESRSMDVETLNSLLDNLELNFPSDFLEHGLVDELLTLDQLQNKLAMLYMADNYKDVQSISLQDHIQLTSAGNSSASKKIAIIYVEGNIVDGNAEEEVAGDRFANLIQDVRNDDSIEAVVLRVNSPGGSVLAAEKIKTQVDSLCQKVPVIASYGDYAASGGYWISANCDYIYANATTLTGSIGVFSLIPDFSKTVNNKLHVNITPVNSNPHADMYSLLRPLSKQETEYMQASVERIYDRFTSIVAEGRDMRLSQVDSIGQGRVWTGAQAYEIGLVDAIGTLDDALLHAALIIDENNGLDNIQVVEYPKQPTLEDMLMEALGGTAVQPTGALKNVWKGFSSWTPDQSGKVYARLPYVMEIK